MENAADINARFLNHLKKWYEAHCSGWGDKGQAAKIVGLSQGYLHNVLNGVRRVSEKNRLRIIETLKFPIDEIYGLPKTIYRKNDNQNNVSETNGAYKATTPPEIEHVSIIQKFADKNLALEINRNLVEIEKIDPARFADLAAYIRHVAGEVRTTKQTQKKIHKIAIDCDCTKGPPAK